MPTNPPIPYDFSVSDPISHLLTVGSMLVVVAAFNQEKALVGTFSVIVQLHRLIVYSTIKFT